VWPTDATFALPDPVTLRRGLVIVWAIGVALLSIRLIGAWWLTRRLVHAHVRPVSDDLKARALELARRLRISRPVRLCESLLVEVPTVVGWLRPVILVPASTLTGLTPNQLQAVLAHELAHVRRHDYLVNLAQAVIETLLFYHPAVWWVSRTVREEREHCCDDLAIALCGDAVAYARALCELEECRAAHANLALAATGGSLVNRVRRILGRPSYDASATSRWLAGALAMAAVLTVVVAPTLQARMQREAPKPEEAATESQWSEVAAAEATPAADSEECAPCPSHAQAEGTTCDTPVAEDAAEAQAAAEAAEAEAAEASWVVEPVAPVAPVPVVVMPWTAATPRPPMTPRSAAAPQTRVAKIFEMNRRALTELVETLKPAVKTLAEAREALVASPVEVHDLHATPSPTPAVRVQRELSRSERRRLQRQGIDEETLNALKESLGSVDVDELVAMHNAGVDPDYVRELSELGYPGLEPEDLRALANSGVSSEWVAAMQWLGYDRLSSSDMVRLSNAGIDAESVSQMRAMGYRNLPVDDLLRLANQGVDARKIAAYRAAGLRHLSVDDLVRLASQGIDPEFVALTRAMDYRFSVDELIRLYASGVDADYINELDQAGCRGLDADGLIKLHNAGVEGETIRILNIKSRR
jgi:beta-lactamase regulating signal transducer with metallopeptidase domain